MSAYAELRDEQEHEMARLILMLNGERECRFSTFATEMRGEHPQMTVGRMQQLYSSYCGWDGRVRPHLSIETGKRL